MAARDSPIAATSDRKIVITRVVDAPRDLVFKAWIEPKHIRQWSSAGEGWTTPFAETDARPSGAFRIGFGSPDGKSDFDFAGIYNEIVEPERLVFTIGDGRPLVATFVEQRAKTKLTLEFTLETENSQEQQRKGWTAMLENLGKH